jgi:predicted nucleotidyltransferase
MNINRLKKKLDKSILKMIEPTLIKKIALKYDLQLIYLFGSKATGRDTKVSDIDIAVLLNDREAHNLKNLILDLIFDFSRVFCSDKIDLVILNKTSLAVQYNVISDGEILYALNPETRYNYEVNLISLYLDFKRYEDEYYEAMQKQILEDIPP